MTQRATIKDLRKVFAFYREHPQGRLRVDWMTEWDFSQFRAWFRRCLHQKISAAGVGRPVQTPQQFQQEQRQRAQEQYMRFDRDALKAWIDGHGARPNFRSEYFLAHYNEDDVDALRFQSDAGKASLERWRQTQAV